MRSLRGVTGVVVMSALIWLPGCGDGESSSLGDFASVPTEPAGSADAGLVVTVDDVRYVVDTELGGYCDIDGETETGSQMSAGGFDAESGTRVELSLRLQTAEWTPSGEDEFSAGLFIASSPVQWATHSTEPWPFGFSDPVSGSLTMEDDNGQPADVSFEIDCA